MDVHWFSLDSCRCSLVFFWILCIVPVFFFGILLSLIVFLQISIGLYCFSLDSHWYSLIFCFGCPLFASIFFFMYFFRNSIDVHWISLEFNWLSLIFVGLVIFISLDYLKLRVFFQNSDILRVVAWLLLDCTLLAAWRLGWALGCWLAAGCWLLAASLAGVWAAAGWAVGCRWLLAGLWAAAGLAGVGAVGSCGLGCCWLADGCWLGSELLLAGLVAAGWAVSCC